MSSMIKRLVHLGVLCFVFIRHFYFYWTSVLILIFFIVLQCHMFFREGYHRDTVTALCELLAGCGADVQASEVLPLWLYNKQLVCPATHMAFITGIYMRALELVDRLLQLDPVDSLNVGSPVHDVALGYLQALVFALSQNACSFAVQVSILSEFD